MQHSQLMASPEALHPSLWRASQLGQGATRCLDTGFAALSAQLPGGGWPSGSLIDLLVQQPGSGELRLLAPALVQDALETLGLPPAPLRGFPPPVPEGGRTLRSGQARSAAALDETLAPTASSEVPPAPLCGFPPPVPEGGRTLRPGQARSAAALDEALAPTPSSDVPLRRCTAP